MKLLLAVDLIEPHPEAVKKASEWAERLQATLDVAFVERKVHVAPYVHDPHVLELLEAEHARNTQRLRQRLDAVLETIPEPWRGKPVYLEGDPVEGIVNISDSYRAVLVGTHGRTGFKRFWLGSVAEQIVRRSAAPVLVIRLERDDDRA